MMSMVTCMTAMMTAVGMASTTMSATTVVSSGIVSMVTSMMSVTTAVVSMQCVVAMHLSMSVESRCSSMVTMFLVFVVSISVVVAVVVSMSFVFSLVMVLLISFQVVVAFFSAMSNILASSLGFGEFIVGSVYSVLVVASILIKSPAKQMDQHMSYLKWIKIGAIIVQVRQKFTYV